MDDAAIVQLYWDRDEQAIPATTEKYGRYCTMIARNILESPEDAEECVNDALLRAWNAIPPHRPGNLSLNRYKHNTAHKRGGSISDYGWHDGLTHVETPIYDVVEYCVPADYPSADLYLATTADLAEYDAHMTQHHGERFSGKGIRVFRFAEGKDTDNFNVWYPDCGEDGFTRIYQVTKSGGKLLTAWRVAGEMGRTLEALACETSADTPMYLVQDGEMLFAMIGKTAYYLPEFTVMKPEVSRMPAIRTEGLDIRTVVFPLAGLQT